MSEADDLIRDLDEALAEVGQDIVLRRMVGQAPNTQNVDVNVRAQVNSPSVQELIAGIAQTDCLVIMSPTQIANAQWPGGETPSLTVVNPAAPRRNDKLIIDGRVRNIEHVDDLSVDNVTVRYNIRASG